MEIVPAEIEVLPDGTVTAAYQPSAASGLAMAPGPNGTSSNGNGNGNGHPGNGHRPRQTVSVVVPARNEQRNIAWVLRRLPAVVDEVILVDGHSVDQTVAIARTVRPDIVVVTENGRGKGAALRAGFAAATCAII